MHIFSKLFTLLIFFAGVPIKVKLKRYVTIYLQQKALKFQTCTTYTIANIGLMKF